MQCCNNHKEDTLQGINSIKCSSENDITGAPAVKNNAACLCKSFYKELDMTLGGKDLVNLCRRWFCVSDRLLRCNTRGARSVLTNEKVCDGCIHRFAPTSRQSTWHTLNSHSAPCSLDTRVSINAVGQKC